MQLRRNIKPASDQPLEITERENLEHSIEGLQNLISKEFANFGIFEIEVGPNNLEAVVEMLPPFSCFLLGRLTTLMDIHRELYGHKRMLPWIKKPENN